MGLRITGEDDGPYPRPTFLILCCDGDHGLFKGPCASFGPGDFISMRASATRVGWKETHRRGERIFLCPECSKRKGIVDESI